MEKKAEEMFEAEQIKSAIDLWDKMSQQTLLSGFFMIKMTLPDSEDCQEVLTIRLEEFDTQRAIPVIRRNISVYPDLHFRLHVGDVEVSSKQTAGDLTAKPGVFSSTTEVHNVMARLKVMDMNVYDLNENDKLNAAAEVLEKATDDKESSFPGQFGQFSAEQLRLRTTPVQRRRYSPMLLSAAMV